MRNNSSLAVLCHLLLGWLAVGTVGCSIEDFIPDSARTPATTGGDEPIPDNAEPPADPTIGYPPHHPGVIEPRVPPLDGEFGTEPIVESIQPEVADADGNEVLTIHGDHFQPGCTVFFGDLEIPDVFYIDEQWLNVTTPKASPGRFDVTVLNPDGGEGTLEDGILIIDELEVHTIDPMVGEPAGGTPIAITGAGFEDGVLVLIGDRLASDVQVVDGGLLTAVTPPGPLGTADVRVVIEGEDVALLDEGFRFGAAPVVSSVWPPHGPTVGGTTIEVGGRYFVPGMTATIGGEPAEVVEVDADGELAVLVTPGGPVGPVTIELSSGDGAGQGTGIFTYLAPATGDLNLVSVFPDSGSAIGGQVVQLVIQGISGTDIAVSFDGNAASSVEETNYPGVIRAVVPPGAVGFADVTVTVGQDSSTLSDGFQYTAGLAVDTVAPAVVDSAGGDFVLLGGVGFTADDDVIVRIGNVPATTFEVQSDTEIVVQVPPCSPGRADVELTVGEATVTLDGAIECVLEGVHVFAVDPPLVAQSGGALVKVIGHGLPTSSALRFGDEWGHDITWTSPETVWVRAPRGEVGEVDLRLSWPGMDGPRTLVGGLTYYDPANKNSGVWGGRIDRSVNVTLFNGSSGKAIEGGFAVLGADPNTPYRCVTDDRGQCTISFRPIQGAQTVTGSADGFSAYTIAGFDGSNVTMFIRSTGGSASSGPPGGGGGGGNPPVNINSLIGTISGKVSGIGKYVIPPAPNCNITGSPDGLQCTACNAATPCAGDLSCTPLYDQGSFCVKSCTGNDDCATGFACADIGFGAQCIPHGGEVSVRCGTSRRSFFGSNPNPGVGAAVDLATNTYAIESRLGEVTVYCIGGYTQPQTGIFVPTIMGIQPTVVVHLFEETPDVDIELNIPLTRTLRARLFDLPSHPDGITNPSYISALDLGAEGWIPFTQSPTWTDGELLYFVGYPESIEPFGLDARYTFYVSLQAAISGNRPASYQLIHKLEKVDGDPVLKRVDDTEGWKDAGSGMRGDLTALWGAADDDIFGVGPAGRIVHRGPLGWAIQPAITDLDFYDVWGEAEDSVWAVGAQGLIMRFDGVVWSAEAKVAPITWDIRSIHRDFAVGDGGIVQRNAAQAWMPHTVLHSKDLRGVHRVHANLVVAVGAGGKILTYANGVWKTRLLDGVDEDLNAVWSDGKTIIVVGDQGRVLWRALNEEWQVGVIGNRDLLTITGGAEGLAWIGGAVGTVLRLDLNTMTTSDETNPDATRIDVRDIWAFGGIVRAVGHTSMPIGPWMDFPQPVSPSWYDVMDTSQVAWNFDEPGPTPTYNQMYMSSSDGYNIWTVMSAGPRHQIALPPLEDMFGWTPLGDGQKYFNLTRSLTPTFSIDGYKFNQTSLWRRLTWSTAFGVFY